MMSITATSGSSQVLFWPLVKCSAQKPCTTSTQAYFLLCVSFCYAYEFYYVWKIKVIGGKGKGKGESAGFS